ncbi:MAG TPA: transposase [Clostridia bacterium]|nr:transposase [Clostridia bacterium]
MARNLRLQCPSAIYHVINRGDRREVIFLDDLDRHCFLETLAQACEKTDWQIHAYCLMSNHFHLVVETPQPNLSAGMKWFLQTYTVRFNHRHNYCGHLFSGRFKAPMVDGSGNGYLRTVAEYVHLNPVRANLLKAEEPLSAYGWSSYPTYLQSERPHWLRVDRVLGECGIPGDTSAGRERFAQVMEQRRHEAVEDDYKPIRRGWCVGSAEFKAELLAQASQQIGPNHFGQERHETGEQKAARILAEELAGLGLTLAEVQSRPGCSQVKLRIARRLRQETTMSLSWIAQQLGIGSWKYLSNLLRQRPSDDSEQPTLGI